MWLFPMFNVMMQRLQVVQWNLYNFGNFIASIINFKLLPKTKIYYALAVFGFQSLTRLINHSFQILWAGFKQENLECFKSANWTLEWISNNYQTLTLMLNNVFLDCFQTLPKAQRTQGSYLIFVIFFTQAKFLENKIYTEIYTVNCQFTQ